jgi:hypothetical protein
VFQHRLRPIRTGEEFRAQGWRVVEAKAARSVLIGESKLQRGGYVEGDLARTRELHTHALTIAARSASPRRRWLASAAWQRSRAMRSAHATCCWKRCRLPIRPRTRRALPMHFAISARSTWHKVSSLAAQRVAQSSGQCVRVQRDRPPGPGSHLPFVCGAFVFRRLR